MQPRRILRAARREGHQLAARLDTEVDLLRTRRGRADVAIFHEFAPSPSGGGHQFLRALVGEVERRGIEIESNRISAGTPVCLFNSFNFDFRRLRRFAGRGARMVHRVDGPIGAYRGFDDGTDARIAEVNAALAAATIFQSEFSLAKHRELGFELRNPVVIPNAVDPAIFHPPASREPLEGRPLRVVAVSWSDNARKGAEALRMLGAEADPKRLELTFVGRSPGDLGGWKVVTPLASVRLAELLRGQDVYVAPSRDDPCSNALLEALSCGLPAAYCDSGGHPELVGGGGLPFRADEELGDVLDRLAVEIDERRAAIATPSLASVTDRYLEALGLRSGT